MAWADHLIDSETYGLVLERFLYDFDSCGLKAARGDGRCLCLDI